MEWYWVPVAILLVVSAFVILMCLIDYVDDKSYTYRMANTKNSARRFLFSFFSIPASFMWPITIPMAIAYGLYKVFQDARR